MLLLIGHQCNLYYNIHNLKNTSIVNICIEKKRNLLLSLVHRLPVCDKHMKINHNEVLYLTLALLFLLLPPLIILFFFRLPQ